jgi:hypothetical protein
MDKQTVVKNLIAALSEFAMDSLSPAEMERWEEITGVLLGRYDPEEQEMQRNEGLRVAPIAGCATWTGILNLSEPPMEIPGAEQTGRTARRFIGVTMGAKTYLIDADEPIEDIANQDGIKTTIQTKGDADPR